MSASRRFWVKMMLKTAWERLLSSFMLVAATVRDLFPSDIRDSMSCRHRYHHHHHSHHHHQILPTHCYFQTTFKTEKSKNGAMYLCKRICENVCVCNCVYMCVCIFMCMYMCVLWMESVFMCVCIFVYYGWKVKNQKRHLQKDLSNKVIGGIRFCAIIKNFSVSDDV